MIPEAENTVSFAPHMPIGEALTFTDLPPLPPEIFDMAGLIDIVYLVTAPVFVILFGIIAWFSRRSVKQNDEAWTLAHAKFDKLVDAMHLLSKNSAATEMQIKMHIDDKSAHNYGRRDKDV